MGILLDILIVLAIVAPLGYFAFRIGKSQEMERMKLTWNTVALACTMAAAIQALEVINRVSHLTTIAWKTGIDSSGVICAGITMIWFFFITTGAFIALGAYTQEKLREIGSPLKYLAGLSVLSLFSGAIIWAGMLISPYVNVASR